MKRIIATWLLVATTSSVWAQWNTDAATSSVQLANPAYNVGFGIAPQVKLHLNGAIRGNSTGGSLRVSTTSGYVDIGAQNSSWTHFVTDRSGYLFDKPLFLANGVIGSNTATDLKFQIGGVTQLTAAHTSGNVGIGVPVPLARLHVAGDLLLETAVPSIYTSSGSTDLNRFLQVGNSPLLNVPVGVKAGGIVVADTYAYANPDKNSLVVKGQVGIGNALTSNPNGYKLIVDGKVNASSFYINDQLVVSSQWVTAGANVHYNGAVGIGTTLTDNPRDYRLAVNGKIGAKDVRVENSSTTWPDYVFAPEYKLPSLREVEQYINKNHHLRDVPAATEVEKNGHELGAMDAILLKKVEELTLYMIELKKENEELRSRIESIEKKK